MLETPLIITKIGSIYSFLVIAYIDPGTGSILLQFLIATLIGAAFYFRRLITNIIHSIRNTLFRKSK